MQMRRGKQLITVRKLKKGDLVIYADKTRDRLCKFDGCWDDEIQEKGSAPRKLLAACMNSSWDGTVFFLRFLDKHGRPTKRRERFTELDVLFDQSSLGFFKRPLGGMLFEYKPG
jgi:hypothetical protein